MADDQNANLEEALQDLNKRNRKMMIAVILVALLGLGGTGGAFGYFMFFKENAAHADVDESHGEKKEESHSGPPEENSMLGPIFNMEELLINLDTRDGTRYLKLTLVLEADEEETLEELTKRMPQLQDITISLVSSKDRVDLQGSDGKYRLREELRYRYNKVLLKGEVTRLYFTQFIIQ